MNILDTLYNFFFEASPDDKYKTQTEETIQTNEYSEYSDLNSAKNQSETAYTSIVSPKYEFTTPYESEKKVRRSNLIDENVTEEILNTFRREPGYQRKYIISCSRRNNQNDNYPTYGGNNDEQDEFYKIRNFVNNKFGGNTTDFNKYNDNMTTPGLF